MSHTPGPWEAAQAGMYKDGKHTITEYFVRRLEDDTAIASDIIDPETCKPSQDNARLIAAVPDLLKACEELLKDMLFVRAQLYGEASGDYATTILARAAITKAKGEA